MVDGLSKDKRLLYRYLSHRQKLMLTERGYFEVVGIDSGTTYRLQPRSADVGLYSNGVHYGIYAKSPIDRTAHLPIYDQALVLKLELERKGGERAILDEACRDYVPFTP